MNLGDVLRTLHQHLPGTTPRFVFEQTPPPTSDFPDVRVDILYTYPSETHTGLMHWHDECSWYVGDTFVVAMELSKFIRLGMKGHPYATELLEMQDVLGAHAWPAPLGSPTEISTWLPACNRWLHQLRDQTFDQV